MRSSISHSERRCPRRAVGLLGLALLTLSLAALYTVRLNPEVRFYRHAIAVKRQHAQFLDRHGGTNKVIVCGGSSAAFSIDGARMLERHGLPVVNFGLHAGMEPRFLVAVAAQSARSGDTFVVAMEPGLLTTPFGKSDLAAQMAFALGEPRLIRATDVTGDRVPWVSGLLSLRPGAYHAFTLLGKVLLAKPLYRYAPRDVQPSGWQQAHDFRDITAALPNTNHLSADAVRLLGALARWGQEHNVRVIYSLPWCYVEPAQTEPFRRASAAFLLEVARLLPVLEDPRLGAYDVRDEFADTEWHLKEAGAAARSDALAEQLVANRFWTQAQLQRLANPSMPPP